MLKTLDWTRTEERAREMTSAQLHYARTDARQTAELWDRAGEGNDPDGNSGYYRDEASVYAREQARRPFTKHGEFHYECNDCGSYLVPSMLQDHQH